jgi:hypothetical protein
VSIDKKEINIYSKPEKKNGSEIKEEPRIWLVA